MVQKWLSFIIRLWWTCAPYRYRCLHRKTSLLCSFFHYGEMERAGGRTNVPSQDVGKTAGAELGRWPGFHCLENFSFPTKHIVSTCFSPRLLISEAGDFGSLQLCLVALLPYLPHPLRISLWATWSTLMNALAVLELGAMPACSKRRLLSLWRPYMTCLHPSWSMSFPLDREASCALHKQKHCKDKHLASKCHSSSFL